MSPFGERRRRISKGFSLIEIMVAMVILGIGLLGMAAMTILVVRGNRGADDLLIATNLCQMKIQALKDIEWRDLGNFEEAAVPTYYQDGDEVVLGRTQGAMVREGSLSPGMGINKLGHDRATQHQIEFSTPESPCYNLPDSLGSACAAHLDGLGPYKFIRAFVICRGDQYTVDAYGTYFPPANSGPSFAAPPVTSSPKPYVEPACRIDPSIPTTRYEALVCRDSDISTTPGAGNREKKIRITCAWRTREGDCRAVSMDTTVVDF